jgi:uncharacterized membrane protein YeaQ/YmgE (transglycosylase-associated protein family)
VTPGLILLVLLGLLCAFFFTRARRRMGLSVSGKHWVTAIVGVVIVLLVAWVAQR